MAMFIAWAICMVGLLVIFFMADIYEARARVYIDTSSRLKVVLGKIASDPDLESRIRLVREAMLGRPQLEIVMHNSGLALRAEDDEQISRLLDRLQETIRIAPGRSRENQNLYTITFQDREREMALAVVSELLDAFVENVIKSKEDGGFVAQSFLQDQIDYYENNLAVAEQRLADFKKNNLGLMPGDGEDYFTRMQNQISAREAAETELVIAISTMNAINAQLTGGASDSGASADGTPSFSPVDIPGATTDIDERIDTVESELAALQLKFTERHPDVLAMSQQLERLQKRREEQLAALRGSSVAQLANNPVYQALQISLNEARVEIAATRGRIAEHKRKETELNGKIATMPQIEAELARLNRDYGSTKKLYNELRNEVERERLVIEGDERAVVNFDIIDPASASLRPVSPNRTFLLLFTLVLGIGGAGAMAYWRDQLGPVFHDMRTLNDVTGLPVLGAVTASWFEDARKQMKRDSIILSASMALLICIFGGGYYYQDTAAEYAQEAMAKIEELTK
jgi:polysaccharide chain length determinant protein (PEP-CTERM system associated)